MDYTIYWFNGKPVYGLLFDNCTINIAAKNIFISMLI